MWDWGFEPHDWLDETINYWMCCFVSVHGLIRTCGWTDMLSSPKHQAFIGSFVMQNWEQNRLCLTDRVGITALSSWKLHSISAVPFGWAASLSLSEASQAALQSHYGDHRRVLIAWHRKCVGALNTVKSGLGTKCKTARLLHHSSITATIHANLYLICRSTMSGMSTLASGMTTIVAQNQPCIQHILYHYDDVT